MNDLRDFLHLLEARGELRRVPAEVDPRLEVAAVVDRVSKSPGGGKALLFEQVRGHAVPIVANLFGSPRRVAWALGVEEIETLAARLGQALAAESGSAAERLRALAKRTTFQPELVGAAPCREVAEADPDLTTLPALQAWPGDGGRFLTLPQVFTSDPDGKERNCGLYRMQIFGPRIAGLHWHPGSDAVRHEAAWQARGERMPVAVALGGDPALLVAAAAPLPAGADEAAFAGFLRGSPLAMTRCLTSDLAVPSGAEFVLEGYVEPHEERPEGPFGNHTGAYAPAAPAPVFHLTHLCRRRAPLYPCTVVGPPPMEDVWLAKAIERLLLPALRFDFPEVVDVNRPIETIFHGCALLSLRRERTRGVADILRGLWRDGLLKGSRLLAAFDEEVDVQDAAGAWWRAVNAVDPGRDLLVEGGRVGIDATRRPAGGEVRAEAATRRLVERRWQEYGID